MDQAKPITTLHERTAKAVSHYWRTRSAQGEKQKKSGKSDQGRRGAVTGGAHMNGFIDLFSELITQAGIPEKFIFTNRAIELPGFFRPTKKWDLLVVRERTLVAAIEVKAQVGSLGNNFNNRAEEATRSTSGLRTENEHISIALSPFLAIFS
jgi:hypothetical protein